MKFRTLLTLQEKRSTLLVLIATVLRLSGSSPAPPSPIPPPPTLLWNGDESIENGRSSSSSGDTDSSLEERPYRPLSLYHHLLPDAYHVIAEYDFPRTSDGVSATLYKPQPPNADQSVQERMPLRRYYYKVGLAAAIASLNFLRDVAGGGPYQNIPAEYRLLEAEQPLLDLLRPQQMYDSAERVTHTRLPSLVTKRALMRLGKRSVMRLGKRGKMRLGK